MDQPALINLSPPDRRLDRALLDAPGGFLWWYVDLIDENGDGLVLIWSFGLPFLPGYASRARRGRAQTPSQRPSLNLSIYRGGQLDFYLLQEYEPGQASWAHRTNKRTNKRTSRWRFGNSRVETSAENGHLTLTADLDCAVQGSAERLTGRVEVAGVCRKPNGCEIGGACHHDWTPRLGPATGSAELAHADHRWQLSGRAYHDRNGGALPLDELGIDYWLWGRAPQPDCELIYYLLWADGAAKPVCKGLCVGADGVTEVDDDLQVELGGRRKNLGGLVWWETISLFRGATPWLTVKNTDVVDSGPFYMRYMTEVESAASQRTSSQPTRGIGELVKPDRVDLAHHRPLVRMRVHDLGGDNSMWLPLFTGPKSGRVRRLLISWVPGSWLGGGRR